MRHYLIKTLGIACFCFLSIASTVCNGAIKPANTPLRDRKPNNAPAEKTKAVQVVTTESGQTCNVQGTADYVIVGAGAAGSVVAARLAEAGYTVILLEAGPDTSWNSTNPNVQCDIPNIETPAFAVIGQFGLCSSPDNTNCGNWHATQTLAEFVSPDQYGTYYVYPRGVGAGGSVSHHTMQDGVGSLQVYDNIANVIKDEYWRGENMQRLFQKMENVSFSQSGHCGTSGWLSVRHSPVEPLAADITNAVVATGVPYRDNFCNPQEADGIGNGQMQSTAGADGKRSYVYQDLLVPVMQQYPDRVQVVFDTLASEIILQQVTGKKNKFKDKYKAVGVRAYNKAYLQVVQPGGANDIVCPTTDCSADPTACEARSVDRSLPETASCYMANKEVIVCGGAIQSPQLLMLSGIGPKTHLKSVGIKIKLDLPGVGSDLMDHCEVNVLYNINPKKFVPAWQAFYIDGMPGLDPTVQMRVTEALQNYPENVLNTCFSQTQWDWYSNGIQEVVPGENYPFPDTHSIPYTGFFFNWDYNYAGNTPQYPGDYFNFSTGNVLPDPADPLDRTGLSNKADYVYGQYAAPRPTVYLDWLVENLKPTVTNGTIRLASSDPRQPPIMHEQLYEDDEGIENMAKTIMQIRAIMNTPAIKNKYSIPRQPWEVFPGPSADVADVDGLKEYIKRWSAFGHHISGTCQMGARNTSTGKPENSKSVLDPRCRVFGVDGLRVADTSVYVTPWLHAFNTSRAAYVVGEAVAEFIINDL